MKNSVLSLGMFAVLSGASYGADVQSLKCEKDLRPVDGNYESVELVRNESGKYDVLYTVITAGAFTPVAETTVKIARNLDQCTFANEDRRIAQCDKSQHEPGESINTGFSTKRRAETSVSDKDGSTFTSKTFEVEIFSPQIAAGGEGFPTVETVSVFRESYSAKGAPGVMLNRCTVN